MPPKTLLLVPQTHPQVESKPVFSAHDASGLSIQSRQQAAWRDVFWLMGLGGLIFLLNLWGYPLFDVDEPRYAETARNMLMVTGDWITPYFNGATRFDKPVLLYWLIAGAYKLFGMSAFAARLVSGIAAMATMLMLYWVGRRELNRTFGLIAALVFATMFEAYTIGRWAITDMTLTCFMTTMWLALYWGLTRSPAWLLVAGISGGLGMLTKGPVAVALPGITFLIFLAWKHRSQWRLLFSPWALGGVALLLGTALPWYMAVAKANPSAFMERFFIFHNVTRFTQTVSGHEGPWYYYIPVLLIGCLPWTFVFPGLIRSCFAAKKTLPAIAQYSLIWFFSVVLFFSFAGTKLLTYVLPALPALALLLGWYWHSKITADNTFTGKWYGMGRLLWIGCGLFAVASGIAWVKPYAFIPAAIRPLYQPVAIQVIATLITVMLALAAWFCKSPGRVRHALVTLIGGTIVIYMVSNLLLFPALARILQTDIMAIAQRTVADNMPLATFKIKKPSLVFYTQQQVYHMTPEQTFPQDAAHDTLPIDHQAVYLVVKNKDLLGLKALRTYKMIRPGYVYSLVLLEADAKDKDMPQ